MATKILLFREVSPLALCLTAFCGYTYFVLYIHLICITHVFLYVEKSNGAQPQTSIGCSLAKHCFLANQPALLSHLV